MLAQIPYDISIVDFEIITEASSHENGPSNELRARAGAGNDRVIFVFYGATEAQEYETKKGVSCFVYEACSI